MVQGLQITCLEWHRVMEISVKKHILSHMLIRRNKVLILYKEQPITCYGCNEQGHQYQD